MEKSAEGKALPDGVLAVGTVVWGDAHPARVTISMWNMLIWV